MKKNILLVGSLIVMASCGRYSQVVELPKKDQKEENPRVYGEVDGPAIQSKQTYETPPDAAEKTARLKELMFGTGKPTTNSDSPAVKSTPEAAQPVSDSAATK